MHDTDWGRRLKQWRETSEKTQLELASEIGITQSEWSRYERGLSYPVADVYEKIIELTGIRMIPRKKGTETHGEQSGRNSE